MILVIYIQACERCSTRLNRLTSGFDTSSFVINELGGLILVKTHGIAVGNVEDQHVISKENTVGKHIFPRLYNAHIITIGGGTHKQNYVGKIIQSGDINVQGLDLICLQVAKVELRCTTRHQTLSFEFRNWVRRTSLKSAKPLSCESRQKFCEVEDGNTTSNQVFCN